MFNDINARLSHLLHALRQSVSCTHYGSRRSNSSRRLSHHATQQSYQLVTTLKCLADAIRHGMLWNRTYGCGIEPIRSRPFWSRSFSLQSQAGGSYDRSGQGIGENDACPSTNLPTNDGTKMGYFDGRLRFYWRHIRYVCSRARHRSVHACRCLCAWMPSKTRNVDRRCYGNSEDYRRRQYSLRWRREAVAAGARTNSPSSQSGRCHDQQELIKQFSSHCDTTSVAGVMR